MGAINFQQSAERLFARLNTNSNKESGQAEKLDASEIAQAKAFGFNLFSLKNDMTQEEFVAEYSDVKFNNKQEEDAFAQKERDIHVKYIQLKYGVKTEIQDGETIEQFEARARQEGLDKAIDDEVDKIVKEFGLDKEPEKEEYVKPDPTMCRDPKNNDW